MLKGGDHKVFSRAGLSKKRQQGITLIELMIGIVVALILMAGVVTVFVNLSTSGSTAIKMTRLNNELRSVSSQITRDLQRAGYVNAWESGTKKVEVEKLNTFGKIGPTAGCDINKAESCSCILYSYDLNDDGVQDDGTANPNEFFGFRFDNTNGEVDMKISGNSMTGCVGGTWEAITSQEIEITALSFEIATADCAYYVFEPAPPSGTDPAAVCAPQTADRALHRRKIDVVIAGRLRRDPEVTLRLQTEVKLMNDQYIDNSFPSP